MTNSRRVGGERGSADMIALIWLAPLLLAASCIVVAAGRVSAAHQQLAHASEAAAQGAALARTPTQAARDARTIALGTLTDTLTCSGGPTVTMDLRNFHAGGSVTVTISCTTARSDLFGPFAPGKQTIVTQSTAVLDSYRATLP